jgi:hypothetical protein
VGYVVVQNPQVSAMLRRLRAGEFGRVERFLGLTLHAYILGPEPKRWEVRKAVSGGGVLINSGGHVLSMIEAAFGTPAGIEVESRRIHSAEVEDSMVIRFRYPQFEGLHCASWSIAGFQRQENRLVVWTERGMLMLSASAALFLGRDGRVELSHQLDFDCGFNLAPDYGGAGFSVEHSGLAAAVREGRQPPMNVEQAIRIEQLLFDAYDAAKSVERFSPASEAVVPELPAAAASKVKRLLDLRELSPATVARFFSGPTPAWDEYLLSTAQLAVAPAGRLRVTVPDFLQQSRRLMAGRYGEVVRHLGVAGVISAGRAALPVAVKARGVSFWAAALGLLAGDLERLPAGFDGTVLVHGYLADLALALDRVEMLEKMLRLCRRARPGALVGFHTNLAAEADNALPQMDVGVDEVSVLSSPRGRQLDEVVRSLRESASVTVEVGPAPALVHQLAARRPQDWLHGADAVMLGPAAEERLVADLRRERAEAWSVAFAGMEWPEAAL